MAAPHDCVEVEIRYLRCCHPPGCRTEVALGRRGQVDGPTIYVNVCSTELPDLARELSGDETARARALALSARIVQMCGVRLTAVRLIDRAPGLIAAEFEVETPYGVAYVPAQPGEGLAASATLGLPLLAERSLLEAPPSAPAQLSDPVRAFLRSLGLDSRADSS